MHEMSIAQSVLDIAVGEMEKNASRGIRKIKISIGEFSGVVKEALEFAFDVLITETPAAKASIEIEVVPMTAKCLECGEFECSINDLNLFCPTCGRIAYINSGREMKVDYLDLE
jgi:hydrogenase nickel incorporation protein HypA/HybF